MARPTKYTPETVAKIIQAIKMGATYELAANYAGIGERTFYDWMEAKPQFSQMVKGAEGEGAMIWLAKIEKAATDGNWQAAAWKLERRYPHMYGRNVTQMELSGAVKVQHGIDTDDPEAAALARAYAARISYGSRNASDVRSGGESEAL